MNLVDILARDYPIHLGIYGFLISIDVVPIAHSRPSVHVDQNAFAVFLHCRQAVRKREIIILKLRLENVLALFGNESPLVMNPHGFANV